MGGANVCHNGVGGCPNENALISIGWQEHQIKNAGSSIEGFPAVACSDGLPMRIIDLLDSYGCRNEQRVPRSASASAAAGRRSRNVLEPGRGSHIGKQSCINDITLYNATGAEQFLVGWFEGWFHNKDENAEAVGHRVTHDFLGNADCLGSAFKRAMQEYLNACSRDGWQVILGANTFACCMLTSVHLMKQRVIGRCGGCQHSFRLSSLRTSCSFWLGIAVRKRLCVSSCMCSVEGRGNPQSLVPSGSGLHVEISDYHHYGEDDINGTKVILNNYEGGRSSDHNDHGIAKCRQ